MGNVYQTIGGKKNGKKNVEQNHIPKVFSQWLTIMIWEMGVKPLG